MRCMYFQELGTFAVFLLLANQILEGNRTAVNKEEKLAQRTYEGWFF